MNTLRQKPQLWIALVLLALPLLVNCNLASDPSPLIVTATPAPGQALIPTVNGDGVIFMVATGSAPATIPAVPTPQLPPSGTIALADQALFNGNYNLAVQVYQDVLNRSDVSADQAAEAYYGLGVAALREAIFDQAATALTTFITQYPDNVRIPQAHFLRGDAYIGLAQWESAIADFERYLQLRPGIIDSYAYERIGDSYLALGRPNVARDNYIAATNATRSIVPLLALRENIADTYSREGEYLRAVAQYDEILAVAENTAYRASIEYQAGLAEIAAGQTERGYARLQAMILQYPETAGAYQGMTTLLAASYEVDAWLRGRISFANEDYPDAIFALETYRTSVAQPPAQALLLLGQAYRANGQYDEALTTFQQILDLYPQGELFGTAWLDQGRTLYWSGDTQGAINRYSQLSQDYPNVIEGAEALWRAGYLYAYELAQYEQAIAVFDSLTTLYPGNEWAQDGLLIAVSLANNLGQTNRVIEFYTELANTGTGENKAMAFLWLGKLYAAEGRADLADDMFVGAIQADPGGYYSLRAADIRTGKQPFTPPTTYRFEFDEGVAIAEAEQWLRDTFGVQQTGILYELGPDLLNDPHMIRGSELWALGAYSEAEEEFATLRQEKIGDALATYQLAHHYAQIGLYVESLRAAASVIELAGISTYDAPSYLARLRYPIHYKDLVLPNAESNNLDPLLIFSLIRQESLFQSYATSFAYAQGLMQIIPDTGQWIAEQLSWEGYQNSDLYRPYVNVRFGAYYLRWVLDYVGGVPYAALSGYNGGPGNAESWLDASGNDFDRFVETVTFDESRTYVIRIYEQYDIYRYLYGMDE